MTNGIDLDARLTAYLELRRALGEKMDRDAGILRDFVRFSQDRGVAVSITSRMVFDWLEAGKQAGSQQSGAAAQFGKAVPAVCERRSPSHSFLWPCGSRPAEQGATHHHGDHG